MTSWTICYDIRGGGREGVAWWFRVADSIQDLSRTVLQMEFSWSWASPYRVAKWVGRGRPWKRVIVLILSCLFVWLFCIILGYTMYGVSRNLAGTAFEIFLLWFWLLCCALKLHGVLIISKVIKYQTFQTSFYSGFESVANIIFSLDTNFHSKL